MSPSEPPYRHAKASRYESIIKVWPPEYETVGCREPAVLGLFRERGKPGEDRDASNGSVDAWQCCIRAVAPIFGLSLEQETRQGRLYTYKLRCGSREHAVTMADFLHSVAMQAWSGRDGQEAIEAMERMLKQMRLAMPGEPVMPPKRGFR